MTNEITGNVASKYAGMSRLQLDIELHNEESFKSAMTIGKWANLYVWAPFGAIVGTSEAVLLGDTDSSIKYFIGTALALGLATLGSYLKARSERNIADIGAARNSLETRLEGGN